MRAAQSTWLRVLLLPLCALPALDGAAQTYPAKVVRYVVPFTGGSGADTLARIVVAGMGPVLGQQVIVDNRGGAAGNIGAEFAARAPADGYTLMQAGMPLAANMSLYKNLAYELSRDFAAVSQLVQSPNMLVVHPSLPVKSVKELIALAKAKPGAINYSSSGAGSTIYLSFEFFKGMAAVDIVHVPYRGGAEAVTAVVSGETSVSFLPLATALPQARQGRLRALAVSTAKRVPSLPEYPTLAEAGVPGYEFGTWYGVMAPAKTPKEIVSVLHAATVTALRNPEVARRLNDLGYVVVGDTPEVFGAYVKAEIERLGKLIRAYKLAVDG
jgi:tripartite-type tricarboxylate transporter receptor subunit TctC